MTSPVHDTSPQRARAALDELSHLLLAAESTQSVLQRVVDLVRSAMPDGVAVSITVLRGEHATTGASSGEPALLLDEVQYRRGHGPCVEAALGGEVVEIADGRSESRWPDYVPAFLGNGALSAIAVPVPASHLAAALNVYASTARAFSAGDREVLVEFAAYAAAALSNMDALEDARGLAENLQRAMDFRSVIEQAKGILMERHKVTADEAFHLLAEASMHVNRKLRDVAEQLVLTGELTP